MLSLGGGFRVRATRTIIFSGIAKTSMYSVRNVSSRSGSKTLTTGATSSLNGELEYGQSDKLIQWDLLTKKSQVECQPRDRLGAERNIHELCQPFLPVCQVINRRRIQL
ncbi:unnamed protein product [Dicrocoelium dendriticum]|nr:unnamed protein product [Dicrocoelium dendriticum]